MVWLLLCRCKYKIHKLYVLRCTAEITNRLIKSTKEFNELIELTNGNLDVNTNISIVINDSISDHYIVNIGG
jgi:hypothetical protein